MEYVIICGDCSKAIKKIKSNFIDEIITSPPYYRKKEYSNIEDEIDSGSRLDYLDRLCRIVRQCYRVLKPTGLFCLNVDSGVREDGFITLSPWKIISEILNKSSFKLVDTLIWHNLQKRPQQSYRRCMTHVYEPIFFLAKSKSYVLNREVLDVMYRRDVWRIDHRSGFVESKEPYDRLGIATFPVDLVRLLMRLGSNHGDWILDPFLGSGTVLDVAIRERRNAIGIEINRKFCEISYDRCFKLAFPEDCLISKAVI